MFGDCGKCAHVGLGKKYVQELMELCYASQLVFYALGPLNGLRRLVATHDKTQTWNQMYEPSVALDLRNRFSTS
jgi:hypothetical protein